ncbi:uncharacterized protein BDR25DRAFT_353823 [Lindgomyces ingoldianus]|uniref:Uncharacterized protein n=1 Tax=Lindgomyces ingoldianus TaxID=673940 RepID=A0ACB6QYT5_9PLEO|nr:uncharacterized protein BDR25DRAFT_353823 [Lindgomyces ingoldianus]KAF2472081.1 hypothetical protein BDR25DRAFT_353823 [Lindgomyces ingoldianus]
MGNKSRKVTLVKAQAFASATSTYRNGIQEVGSKKAGEQSLVDSELNRIQTFLGPMVVCDGYSSFNPGIIFEGIRALESGIRGTGLESCNFRRRGDGLPIWEEPRADIVNVAVEKHTGAEPETKTTSEYNNHKKCQRPTKFSFEVEKNTLNRAKTRDCTLKEVEKLVELLLWQLRYCSMDLRFKGTSSLIRGIELLMFLPGLEHQREISKAHVHHLKCLSGSTKEALKGGYLKSVSGTSNDTVDSRLVSSKTGFFRRIGSTFHCDMHRQHEDSLDLSQPIERLTSRRAVEATRSYHIQYEAGMDSIWASDSQFVWNICDIEVVFSPFKDALGSQFSYLECLPSGFLERHSSKASVAEFMYSHVFVVQYITQVNRMELALTVHIHVLSADQIWVANFQLEACGSGSGGKLVVSSESLEYMAATVERMKSVQEAEIISLVKSRRAGRPSGMCYGNRAAPSECVVHCSATLSNVQ